MNATYWVYVRRPQGGFVRLSAKRFNDFHFNRGRLDLNLADDERYLRTAELTIQLQAGVPQRVLNASFRRLRLSATGSADEDHERLERERMFLKMNARHEAAETPERGGEPSFPGLLRASSRFQAKRLDAECTWNPTREELNTLGDLLGGRIQKRASSRERQVALLLAKPLSDRVRVAGATNSKEWELGTLAQAAEPAVRAEVAANRATPIKVLEQLYDDPAPEVVVALAGNLSVSQEWLSAKAKDQREQVRAAVAANGCIPGFVLERLAWSDRSEVVRAAAKTQLDWALSTAVSWASSPHASLLSLRQDARDRRPEVRAAVAQNPRTPLEILVLLADDTDAAIRAIVARRAGVEDSRSLLVATKAAGKQAGKARQSAFRWKRRGHAGEG